MVSLDTMRFIGLPTINGSGEASCSCGLKIIEKNRINHRININKTEIGMNKILINLARLFKKPDIRITKVEGGLS